MNIRLHSMLTGYYLGIALLLVTTGVGAAIAGGSETGGDSVCLQCHASQAARLSAPIAAWQGSVHARNGVGCHSCHGGDPNDFAMAMSPERGFLGVPLPAAIPDFCGRCHIGVREDYGLSAHGRALGRGGAHCVNCHGNHGVQVASIALIDQEHCTKCHDFARAEQIRASVAETEQKLQSTDRRLPALQRIGIATKPHADELFAIRNDFRRLFHRVEAGTLTRETAAFDQRIANVEKKIATIENDLAQRRLIGAGLVLLLVVSGFVLLLIRRSYQTEEEKAPPAA